MQMHRIFLVYRFSKKRSLSWGRILSLLIEAVFAALVYWLDYFISGFVHDEQPFRVSFNGKLVHRCLSW